MFGVILSGVVAVHLMGAEEPNPLSTHERFGHCSKNVRRAILKLQEHVFEVGAARLGRKHSKTNDLVRMWSSRGLIRAYSMRNGPEVCKLKAGDTVGEAALTADIVSVGPDEDLTQASVVLRDGVHMKLIGEETATLRAETEVQVAALNRWKFEEIMKAQQLFISPNSAQAKLAFQTAPAARTAAQCGVMITVIGNFPFVRNVPTYARDQLCTMFEHVVLRRGDVAYLQQDQADKFFLVVEGSVSLHQQPDPEHLRLVRTAAAKALKRDAAKKGCACFRLQSFAVCLGLVVHLFCPSCPPPCAAPRRSSGPRPLAR